ncbi:MAG: hypothetical protein JOZ29_14340, partial [Deltaproteobacteria bacterium]|nr:hypothetical protein [Deltaproteobacteria bacterium]
MYYPSGYIRGTIVKSQIGSFKFAVLSFFIVSMVIVTLSSFSILFPAFGATTPAVVIKMSDKPPKFLPDKV